MAARQASGAAACQISIKLSRFRSLLLLDYNLVLCLVIGSHHDLDLVFVSDLILNERGAKYAVKRIDIGRGLHNKHGDWMSLYVYAIYKSF